MLQCTAWDLWSKQLTQMASWGAACRCSGQSLNRAPGFQDGEARQKLFNQIAPAYDQACCSKLLEWLSCTPAAVQDMLLGHGTAGTWHLQAACAAVPDRPQGTM